jgi:hypothetical protein
MRLILQLCDLSSWALATLSNELRLSAEGTAIVSYRNLSYENNNDLERGVYRDGNNYRVIVGGKRIGTYSCKDEANTVARRAIEMLHREFSFEASRKPRDIA